ncbi:spore germination protein [Bacillus sp. B-TM1]
MRPNQMVKTAINKGFAIGMTILILFLTSIKSLQTPYLWPFLPFDWGALTKILPLPYTISTLSVQKKCLIFVKKQ